MALDVTLYLITNSDTKSEADFLATVDAACRGGVTLVQLREKDRPGREIYELALKTKQITDAHGIPLVVDDRVDIALAAGCGVHLGQTDLPIGVAREILGEHAIVGATAKTVDQAVLAAEQGASYLGVGAIFPTKTKVQTVVTPVATLSDIVAAVSIPIVAIGGLDATNLAVLRGSGADGVAVVRAIMDAPDATRAASDLRCAVLDVLALT